MTDDLLDWGGEAVRGILCGVSGCTAHPVAERNGRNLCAEHRDHYDHATMGQPCDRCGSEQWVETPEAASVAVCSVCDFVTYDECDRCADRPADPDVAPRTDPDLCRQCVTEIKREAGSQ